MNKTEATNMIKNAIEQLDVDRIRNNWNPMIEFGVQLYDALGECDHDKLEKLVQNEQVCKIVVDRFPHYFKAEGPYLQVIDDDTFCPMCGQGYVNSFLKECDPFETCKCGNRICDIRTS